MTATERERMKKWCLPDDPPLRTPRLWRVPSAHSAQWQWSSSRSSVQKSRKRGKLCLHCNTSYTCIVGLITLHTLHSDKIVTIIIAEVEKQISIWGQVNFSKSLLTLTDFFTNQYCVIVNSLLCLIVCKISVMLSTNVIFSVWCGKLQEQSAGEVVCAWCTLGALQTVQVTGWLTAGTVGMVRQINVGV